jgi:6-phosphogluconolactonase
MANRQIYISSALAAPGDEHDGLYGYEQDRATGALVATGAFGHTVGASFVASDPSGTRLYTTRARPDGGAAAFAVEEDGSLRALGEVDTGGAGPCHVSVHRRGRFLFTAHYGSGHLSVHRLGADGAIGERTDLVRPEGSGPDPDRQTHAHAHFAWPEPSGRFVLLVDLGTDTLWTYALDTATGRLQQTAASKADPGSGPRHPRLHPDGYLLVTGELTSALMTFDYNPESGRASHRSSVSASRQARAGKNAPSELVLGAGGRFCYVANRGPDTIAVFSLQGGKPDLIDEVGCGGLVPRHLAVVGDYLYVANQESGTVDTFALGEDGIPWPTGTVVRLPRPYCVRALP